MVHGDFHPLNVFLEEDGGLKVIDFMNMMRSPAEYDIARTYFLIGEVMVTTIVLIFSDFIIRFTVDENGRAYTTVPLHAPGETKDGVTGGEFKGIKPPKGRHWRTAPAELEKLDEQGLLEWSKNGVTRRKIFAEEQKGKKMQDIWDFKDYQYPVYPTEKNIDLLKHIVKTSSNENGIVMDFFCGSGTTLCAAQELCRKWIGIDKSEQAIKVSKNRLSDIQDTLLSENKFDSIVLKENYVEENAAVAM